MNIEQTNIEQTNIEHRTPNTERRRCARHLVLATNTTGAAVLDARMLYQLKEIKNFSDDTLCIPAGQRASRVSQRKSEQPLQIRLVPNPANEIVRIEGLTLGANEVALVELADLNGRIIETTSLNGDQPAFNLNQVPQGVYACRIIKNGMLFQTLKLIVIH